MYYRQYYLQYEEIIDDVLSTNTDQYENTILVSRKSKTLRASHRRITNNEVERYLQDSLLINFEERHLEDV